MTVAQLKRALEQLPDDILVLTRKGEEYLGWFSEADAVPKMVAPMDGITWTTYANTEDRTENVLLII